LSDGNAVFLARVEKVGHDVVEFATLEPIESRVPHLRAALLLAVVKFDRFEWALEKATDLGVERIVPLAAERSEKALVAASAKRADRWRRILVESAQQARCMRVPVLESAMRPTEAFRHVSAGSSRILLSERPDAPTLRNVLEAETASRAGAAMDAGPAQVAFGVGPEGGWTDAEFLAATSAGFLGARLGDNILRTETAVVAGLAGLHLYFDGRSGDATAGDERKRASDGILREDLP
jgi:16S rRNA (uracil1498-N3)-methyltransferase